MVKTAVDLLMIVAAFAVGECVVWFVTFRLRPLTGDGELSAMVGTGVWVVSVPTIYAYATLWLTDPEDIANPPRRRSVVEPWRKITAENALQASEWTMGLAYAMLGGGMAWRNNGAFLAIVIMAVCCGGAGALIGFDYKRRVLRIRAAWNLCHGRQPAGPRTD